MGIRVLKFKNLSIWSEFNYHWQISTYAFGCMLLLYIEKPLIALDEPWVSVTLNRLFTCTYLVRISWAMWPQNYHTCKFVAGNNYFMLLSLIRIGTNQNFTMTLSSSRCIVYVAVPFFLFLLLLLSFFTHVCLCEKWDWIATAIIFRGCKKIYSKCFHCFFHSCDPSGLTSSWVTLLVRFILSVKIYGGFFKLANWNLFSFFFFNIVLLYFSNDWCIRSENFHLNVYAFVFHTKTTYKLFFYLYSNFSKTLAIN